MNKKKLLFLTGTRADFGKLKSLIKICLGSPEFEVKIFATGMHMHHKHGYTVTEIEKSGFVVYKYINYTSESTMDLTLAKTIDGLSSYVLEEKPDLIIVHGDRVEALAGAIVGALKNILVAHIEGGEVSGTIDELIRHSVSKMSHTHFVSNKLAKMRLLQMGELDNNIYEIGSPDVDVMMSDKLPGLEEVLNYYEVPFEEYGILMFHPVTTEENTIFSTALQIVDAVSESGRNYIVINPNNDLGASHILRAYEKLSGNPRFKVFPSIRFEYFLVLLKNSFFIVGNSSAGIREAPYYGVPSINVGSRQNSRSMNPEIFNTNSEKNEILEAINKAISNGHYTPQHLFGMGNSDQLFLQTLQNPVFWETKKQKKFNDI